jgi:multidrug efflux system outer membrane protein
MRRLTLSLAVAALTSGCALTPDYERPELDVPAGFQAQEAAGASIANLEWWELFGDEALQNLIRTALEENKDLGVALSRIAEARSALTITRADQLPFIDVTGRAGRLKQSEDLVPGSGARGDYGLAGEVSYELDLWGQLRRATEASQADLLATEAAYRNVTISLVANVASFYLLLRDLDQRLQISVDTVATRKESLTIVEARFDKGTVPQIDVNQAEVELAIAEAAVASFEREIVLTENSLRILLGRNPGPVDRGLRLDQQVFPPAVPAGLPSELVQRRPDVVQAEEVLIAETARVGVAEALRYPSISLTGSYGTASDELEDLTGSSAETWGIGANIFAPIFNSGALKAQAQAQRARAEAALLDYELTLQQAFREVEDALVSIRTLRVEHAARVRQVVAARNAARLSKARYDGGVVDYLEVLDSERARFNAELEESRTLQQYLNAIVELYKALGGGWSPAP